MEPKLKACVSGLTAWRKKERGNEQVVISKLQKSLLKLQTREDTGAEIAIKKVQDELGQLLDKEEMWWRQRAKEEWLKFGDHNTRFFHACASTRQRQTKMGQNGIPRERWKEPL